MKTLLTATVLATMLALNLGMSSASADGIIYYNYADGSYDAHLLDDDGKVKDIFYYDKNGKYEGRASDGNPSPHGGNSGVGPTKGDVQGDIQQLLKNGGLFQAERDFFETPFGKLLVETGKTGSIVPYYNPVDALAYGFEGGGGGNGGIDMMGGNIGEQIKRNAGKKKKDDDDDDDGSGGPGTDDDDLEFGGASASMELVNPVPETMLRSQSPAVGSLMARRLQSLAAMSRPRAAAPRPMATQVLRPAATARFAR